MRPAICVLFTTALCAIGQSGCIGPQRPTPLTPDESEALETVRRQLVVLPVFTGSAVSGFPISSRNVISAAHAFHECSALSAVGGLPMLVAPGKQPTESLPPERDWICVYATTDRFSPNVIDGTVVLRRGDLVFFGGYRPTTPPHDPIRHTHQTPEILAGRVVRPYHSEGGPCVVEVEVPVGDYHGFSGGPAAILDETGHVRVWGALVSGGWILDPWPPWRRRFVLKVARLPQKVVGHLQHGKFLNATEVPQATSAPASRPTSSVTEPQRVMSDRQKSG